VTRVGRSVAATRTCAKLSQAHTTVGPDRTGPTALSASLAQVPSRGSPPPPPPSRFFLVLVPGGSLGAVREEAGRRVDGRVAVSAQGDRTRRRRRLCVARPRAATRRAASLTEPFASVSRPRTCPNPSPRCRDRRL
jgi:hypothetical protein